MDARDSGQRGQQGGDLRALLRELLAAAGELGAGE
jgi:hypothetical protein